MIASTRPISFLFLLLGMIAIIVQGYRIEPSLQSSSTSNMSSNPKLMQSAKLSPLMRSILNLRGGEDSDDEEEEGDDDSSDEENDEETPSGGIDYAAILAKVVDVSTEVLDVTKAKVLPVVVKYSKKGAVTAKNTSISIYHALHRAFCAALEGEEAVESDDSDDEDSDDEDGEKVTTAMDKIIGISKKAVTIFQRMVKAALTVPEVDDDMEEDEIDEEGDDENATETTEENEDSSAAEDEQISATTTLDNDFGSYLSKSYDVEDMRGDGKSQGPTIMGGSLQDALRIARQQARMLLVFIPSQRPKGERGVLSFFGSSKKSDAEVDEKDRVAIESLLSKEVGKAANKKARKSKDSDNDHGSFAIWVGKAGSSESISAMKQLKVKETSAKGEKRPILCVVYPASAPVGSDKMVPKILAQHHCNPPLQAESMASWMNALRKRHGKQYQKMQTDLTELKLYKERKEGYIDSVQSDNERKLKEAKEEAERKAQEIKEAARQAEIDARRQELQESLPEDVKKGNNVKKIALRFPDGRSGQRGFESDQPLSVVFDWVDAMFEIERETVVLTTLNGKQTFSWNDDQTKSGKTLEDAGLNKNTAFRVSKA